MIVLTLSKVPPSLRGDLTKWYSEIQTGVFVGNVSARVRDRLWQRVLANIGHGEATMVFNAQNELGYQFLTTRADHAVVDYDGLPFMMRRDHTDTTVDPGFSQAAKFHQAHKYQGRRR
ncbi:type I-E CRISPR-associated endoribonuclease Cas2e [Lacticaseibacillus absianus]|uniref:type I-E CRISPR-associated endoribonuclease Cas2e n=1 Tax=Lacticaseibacillus absianus TaxID=2729623 RepID=UPI0031B622EB